MGTPNTSANYIVKIQTGTPSEAVTGENSCRHRDRHRNSKWYYYWYKYCIQYCSNRKYSKRGSNWSKDCFCYYYRYEYYKWYYYGFKNRLLLMVILLQVLKLDHSATITIGSNMVNGTITGTQIANSTITEYYKWYYYWSATIKVVIWLMVLLQVLKLQTQPLRNYYYRQ